MLYDNIGEIKGVGDKRAVLLNKLGITNVADLLEYFPRAYEDRSNIKQINQLNKSEFAGVKAKVASKTFPFKIRKGLSKSTIRVYDLSGALDITFFNQDYATKNLKIGEEYMFFGKIDDYKIKMLNPSIEKIALNDCDARPILPLYRLTSGLTQKFMSKIIDTALDENAKHIQESLCPMLIEKYNFLSLKDCFHLVHHPKSMDDVNNAKRRLLYEEFLLICLRLAQMKKTRAKTVGIKFDDVDISDFLNQLAYSLTNSQKKVISEILSDVTSSSQMNRLVQGDVGCGKTMVAAVAMYVSAKNGYQAALMAPTEILARQHFSSLSPIFQKLGINVAVLYGGMKKSERNSILAKIADGSVDIVIGTHALLTEDVKFKNLAVIITDEQHRFGVAQRATLVAKGVNPHILVMSATPIPRTLALIIFGELDISIIDELPPGRQKIDTFLIDDSIRQRMYNFLKKLVYSGKQGYIVCPAIDENDSTQIAAATVYAENLIQNEFSDITIALLHGKMKATEKKQIMEKYVAGDIKILVSTTVIEVGVDVPNSVFMVIENAERFGLSTLHQLRGRVGRGTDKSYCILVSNIKNSNSLERLKVFTKTNDGFKIAEVDLQDRGPGDFFGNRQHGLPLFKLATLASDMRILKQAEQDAVEILKNDPELQNAENKGLYEKSSILFEYDSKNSINIMN